MHSLSASWGANLLWLAPADPPTCQYEQTMWPDRRLLDLIKTEFPIVLAPMAGVMDAELVIAAAQGGALGSLPCAMLSVEKAREQVNIIRQRVSAPVNMNFFCHQSVDADPKREAGWQQRLAPYYKELGLDPAAPINAGARRSQPDLAGCAGISPCCDRLGAAEGRGRKARQGRFHQSLGRAGSALGPGDTRRGADPGPGRGGIAAVEPDGGLRRPRLRRKSPLCYRAG